MTTETLLVEIRSEDLPPAQVRALATNFPQQLRNALITAGFADENSTLAADENGVLSLATPRRFAALINQVCSTSAQFQQCQRGPALAACYDAQGKPTKALNGFMHSAQVRDPSALITIEEKGREYIAVNKNCGGIALADALADIVQTVLLAVNAPRLMHWGDHAFKFIRPLSGVLLMHGSEVLNGSVLGIATTAHSIGHPTLAPQEFLLPHADAYEQTLAESGCIIVDIRKRKQAIVAQFNGSTPQPQTLLEEVTSMCEQPTVYRGEIDKDFLALPAFCVEECMVKHQRFFPIYEQGVLTPAYRLIADNHPAHPTGMINGFNTVLRARLRDVEFYLQEDKKLSLAAAQDKLEHIVYHRQLGNQRQRLQRLRAIATAISADLPLRAEQQQQVIAAATICKSDLPTLMIGEYPELEGLMAAFYFCDDDSAVADLVRAHNRRDWQAAAATMPDPNGLYALLLTLQLEKLVGMFSVGEKPSGSKDPHGLRTAAAITSGILSVCQRQLSLDDLLEKVATVFSPSAPIDTSEVKHFIIERKRQELLEAGRAAATLNAILTQPHFYLCDIEEKATALTKFLRLPEAAALIETHKRLNNILRKSTDVEIPTTVDSALFSQEEEHALYQQLNLQQQQNARAAEQHDYATILANTAKMHDPIDRFFAEVLVNDKDPTLRRNRLALLMQLHRFFNTVGDLSKLFGG